MTESNRITQATSIAEMLARFAQFDDVHVKGVSMGLAYRAQPTDVFISPYPKCGTTWLQQIVHGLRTGGDMGFDDISRVIPWLEWAHEQGIDLYAPQAGTFKAFKSHVYWQAIPKGGRYIVSFRDPKDALVSFYHFFDGFEFKAGSVSITEFAREFFMAEPLGRYWDHLASWWEQRHNPNVLLLCFEEMKVNLVSTVQAVARFVGVKLNKSLLDIVVRQSSFDFMLAHKEKFDELLMRELLAKTRGLPPGVDAAKVRTGRTGDHKKELPAAIAAEMDHIWRREIQPRFGFENYDDLRRALRLLNSNQQDRKP